MSSVRLPQAPRAPRADRTPGPVRASTPRVASEPASGARAALRTAGDALSEAWAVRAVRRGFLGVVLITIGSATPAYLPEANPFRQVLGVTFLHTPVGTALGTALLMLGVGLLLDAWFATRPSRRPDLSYPAVIALWSLPFLLVPPIFSADAYAYAAEGWLIHHGLNPYEVGVGALPGPLAEQTVQVWRWTPAPYGPLDLQLNHLVVDLFRGHPYWAVVGMRLPVLVALGAMLHLVPRIAGRLGVDGRLAVWLGLVNPLIFVHVVGGAHNDALMMALVVGALWLALQGRLLIPVVLVAAAAAIKLPAILAILAVAVLADPVLSRGSSLSLARLRPGTVLLDQRARIVRTIRRGLVASGLVILVFGAINLATGLGFGWIAGMNVPGMVKTMSPSTMVGEVFSQMFYGLGLYDFSWTSIRVVRTLFMVACVALIGYLALTLAHRRPVTSLAWSLLAVALCGPALHGWYLTWSGVLIGLTRPSRRMLRVGVWVSAGLLAYIAMNLAWKNGATAIGVVGLGLIGWRVWIFDRFGLHELGGVPSPRVSLLPLNPLRLLEPARRPAGNR